MQIINILCNWINAFRSTGENTPSHQKVFMLYLVYCVCVMRLLYRVQTKEIHMPESQIYMLPGEKGYHCEYCGKRVPFRSKHLRRTNKHYLTFDHDCVFLKTVICEKNYVLYMILEPAEVLYHFATYKMCFLTTDVENISVMHRKYPNTAKCCVISLFFFTLLGIHYAMQLLLLLADTT